MASKNLVFAYFEAYIFLPQIFHSCKYCLRFSNAYLNPVFGSAHCNCQSSKNTGTCGKNDVLPLKAARRDAIANSKRLWGLRHQRPNFEGYIYIHYAAPPYSACISATYFLLFGNVWLGSREKHNAEFTKVG